MVLIVPFLTFYLGSKELDSGISPWPPFISNIQYINDLPLCTKLLSKLFADDTMLQASGNNINELTQSVSIKLRKVSTYLEKINYHLMQGKPNMSSFPNQEPYRTRTIEEELKQKTRQNVVVFDWGSRSNAALGNFGVKV